MASDFLERCVASRTGNPVLEQIRSRSADVMLAAFRLLKTSLVHDLDNAAVRESAAQAAEILAGFASEVGSAVTITFVEDSSFVCGELLRASRNVYESATELGELLDRAGASELAFEASVTQADVLALAQALVKALRDGQGRDVLITAKIPNISVRKVDPHLVRRTPEDELQPAERMLRLYANALVVMRQFYEDIAQGLTILPHRVKRLAQRFVAASDEQDPALLGMSAMAKTHRDEAGRAVQTAILALAIGRQITRDRVALAQLVMAGLLADAGAARVTGRIGNERTLSDAEQARVPASAALTCIATGGVNPTSATRAVVITETSWAECGLGPVWDGSREALLASRVMVLARDLLERVAPRGGNQRPLSPSDALERVSRSDAHDPALVRLLVRAIGVLPSGTVVELETGAWAVVTGPSATGPHAFCVRVVTDDKGRALEDAKAIDLGQDRTAPRIVKFIEPEQARFNVTRAFMS